MVAREVGGETVILDLESGTYFGLNPVGARMWQLMGDGMTLAEVRDVMLEEYEVTSETLERDLLDLVEQLAARNLVVRRA